MRVLKTLAVRFVLVFVCYLVFSLLSEHMYTATPVVAILDRRYQLTLAALKDRQRSFPYTDYKIKSGTWAPVMEQSVCLAGQDNKVVLLPCQGTNSYNNWTIHFSRNPDKRDHISLPGLEKCIDVGAVRKPEEGPLILYGCHGAVTQELSYDFTSQMIYHGDSNNCVEYEEGEEGHVVKYRPCNLKKREQKWHITRTDDAQ